MRREQYLVFQSALHLLLQFDKLLVVVGEEVFYLHLNGHVVVILVSGERDEVVAGKFLKLHQYLLYLYREDIYATQYHHIVAATLHTVEAHMISATRTTSAKHTGEVACAIAQQRHSLTTDRGEHQFAYLAIGHWLKGLRVNYLNDVIVLPEVETILLLTLKAHARTTHLRHAE